MTDPTGRPEPRSASEETLRAVRADRARVLAAQRAAARRRHSPLGHLERGRRWLRDRRGGPVGRVRMAVAVIRAAIRDGGPWRSLPAGVIRALRTPVGTLPRAEVRPPRDPRHERVAAARRLIAARSSLADRTPATLRLALIADAADEAALVATGPATTLRPEDWMSVLETEAPDAVLVTSARAGGHGAWTYRVAWVAHPDRILGGALEALLAWCRERDIPSVFALTTGETAALDEWLDAADRCDLVLVPDAASAARISADPGRRGAAVVVDTPDRPGLLRALVADRAELVA